MIPYRLRTVHGTTVCVDPATMAFVHGVPSPGLPPAMLLLVSPWAGLLVGVAGGPEAISFTVSGYRVMRGAGEGMLGLVEPDADRFLTAEPAPEGSAGQMTALREVQGVWETFELQAAGAGTTEQEAGLVGQAGAALAAEPSADGLLGALDRRPDGFAGALLWQWFRTLQLDPADRLELLVAHPAARAQVGVGDPWLSMGVDDLAGWLRNRDGRPSRLRIGPELDVLGRAGEGARRLGQRCASQLRRRASPRRSACVVATARNEGPYLLEWIAYHRLLGFEHVFLYTNDNSDQSDHLLAALAEAREITWVESVVGAQTRPQYKAYGHALGILPDTLDYEWAMFIDIDEFLVLDPSRFRNVQEYLQWMGQRQTDCVLLNWMMFGMFGEATARDFAPLTGRSFMRDANANPHVKPIVRPRMADHGEAHFPWGDPAVKLVFRDSSGQLYKPGELFALAAEPKATHAWVNHYWSKSFDELLLKFGRNRGDMFSVAGRPTIEIARDIDERVLDFEAKLSPVMDRRLEPVQPRLRAEMARLRALPGVAEAEARSVHEARVQIDAALRAVAALDLGSMPRLGDVVRNRLALLPG